MSNPFNNNETSNLIIDLMKKEKNVRVYKKLSFLRNRSMGYSVEESAKRSFISKSGGYKIQDEWMESGYNGLLSSERKEGSGRKTKLNKRQLKQLSKILETENDLTIPDIQNIIKDKWNIEYTYMGVKTLLKNQFNVDVNEYLDYYPKSNNSEETITKASEELDFDDEEVDAIIDCIQGEKTVFVLRKLFSFFLQKEGRSLNYISKVLGVTTETLVSWNNQWADGGYKALLKKEGQGRKSKLSDEQWDKIYKVMEKQNDWTLPEIAYEIETRYGVKYSLPHLAKLLKKN